MKISQQTYQIQFPGYGVQTLEFPLYESPFESLCNEEDATELIMTTLGAGDADEDGWIHGVAKVHGSPDETFQVRRF